MNFVVSLTRGPFVPLEIIPTSVLTITQSVVVRVYIKSRSLQLLNVAI